MKLGVWLAFLDRQNGNPSRKGRKTIDLYCYIKVLKVKPVYQQMTLSPKLGVVGIGTLWHFRLPLPIQLFIKVASSPRLSGIGMPSLILWSHPLKMQRIVLLSSLLWWELGTNSLITGPGEWLSFRRFTSKLSWSWSATIQWGWMSEFWSDPSSTSILHVYEQQRLWRELSLVAFVMSTIISWAG